MLRRSSFNFCLAAAASATTPTSSSTSTQHQQQPPRDDILSILEASKRKEEQELESQRKLLQTHKRNAEIVKNALRRLLAQPHYGNCPVRRRSIQQAIKTVSECSTSTNTNGDDLSFSPSSSPSSSSTPITIEDLVLDSVRDGVDKKYHALGAGLRRIALEALDPSLTNYTCTSPLGGPIPHADVESHVDKIREFAKFLNPNWMVVPVGRHRRGALASRSIDVLITDPSTRSSGANFSQAMQQDAPFIVLSRMKKAMESAGYAIYCQQQKGRGIATLAALVQHEPFDKDSSSKLVADEDRYLAKKMMIDFRSSSASKKTESENNNHNTAKPLFNFPLASPSSSVSLHQQKQQHQNNNKSTTPFDISTGQVPSEYVSPKAESLMSKILKLHQKQQARIRQEQQKEELARKTRESNRTNTHLNNNDTKEVDADEKEKDEGQSKKNENNEHDNDENAELEKEELELCMELALEECPPLRRKKVLLPKTSGGVLRDIHSEIEEDDDNETRGSNSEDLEEDEDEMNGNNTEDEDILHDGLTVESTPKSSLSEKQQNVKAAENENENNKTKNTTTNKFNTDLEKLHNKTARKLKTKGADKRSFSMSSIAGITITKHFPLNPKQVPRRLNLVWAPYDRFHALMLLLTGPKEFSSYLMDRAPRFGYRLTEDGIFEQLSMPKTTTMSRNVGGSSLDNNIDDYDDNDDDDDRIGNEGERETVTNRERSRMRPCKRFDISPVSKREVVINSESELLEKLKMGYLFPMDR